MKIVKLEAIPFQLPRRRDFRWAGLLVGVGAFVLLKVTTDEGIVGLGEATPLPDWGGDFDRRGGETARTVVTMIEDVFAPVLVGSDPRDVERRRLDLARVARGNVYAKNAVDIALHDIAAQAAGVPLYRYLGGKVRDSVVVSHMVGIMPNEEAIPEAVGAVADGAEALQIKGGEDAERDIALVKALRKELGPGPKIRIDANQGYRYPKQAIAIVRRLEEAGVDLVEQPVTGHAEMRRVAEAVDVPIIADESCWDAREAIELVTAGAADCISIYLAKAGGISGARRVAAVAEAMSRQCDVNGSLESGVGNAANLHFALATAPVELPCVVPVNAPAGAHKTKVAGHYYVDDIIAEPFPFADGALLPLERPGLGIVLDEKKLQKFRIG